MEEKNFKITVIIKTSDSEATLCNTLESVKELDEIIIIDEHSTDDTAAIAQEYKTKIIYSNKGELLNSLNQALYEAKGSWIFVVKDNEIIPQKLIYEIRNYIETHTKKQKTTIAVPLKTFYYNKEIKSFSEKSVIRIFKKDACCFYNNFSTDLKLQKGKVHKINKYFRLKNAYILSYEENNISKKINFLLDKNKIFLKNNKARSCSIFIRPVFVFIKQYIFKKSIFDGKYGYILSVQKFIEEFIKQIMILDKYIKGGKNDF